MKKTVATAAASLLLLGIAGTTPAAAYHLIPENTTFEGTGKTSATKSGISLACDAVLEGSVDSKGVGSVTGGSFTGQLGCTSVQLQNLPWKSVAKKATTAIISNVTFSSPIGNCGPGKLKVKVKNGKITFTDAALPGNCTISGSIKTQPAIAIVP
ncbi:MAG TPA: hypothetical protein VHE09_11890 [Rhizomicrobium sp.]|jgi:hypothetical protein|nr:hypothetical protein [Rhizomicrobium sp.]